MIQFERVSKTFGALPALRDVTLTITPGERVAFVGANGSGKTTLLRALLGLVRVKGRVTLEGVDVAEQPERALSGVAYVPQVAPPIQAPVREVVRAVAALRGIDEARVVERALALGLSLEKFHRLRFSDLSGGMKQKLLAAAALAAEPRVLVCDEPTANLDAEARQRFFEQVRSGPPDRILILCSHRSEEVRALVGRIVELKEGRIDRDVTIDARTQWKEAS